MKLIINSIFCAGVPLIIFVLVNQCPGQSCERNHSLREEIVYYVAPCESNSLHDALMMRDQFCSTSRNHNLHIGAKGEVYDYTFQNSSSQCELLKTALVRSFSVFDFNARSGCAANLLCRNIGSGRDTLPALAVPVTAVLNYVIQSEDYLRNVGRKFISILQEREITGNGMPMQSFNATINQTILDVSAIGIAKFHSGFIAKIDASGILSTSYRATTLAAYSNAYCFLTFDGVQTVYDVDYEYEDYKRRGSVLTWYKQLQFEMKIQRNHTTNELTSTIVLSSTGNQNDYVVKVDPNNGYTQLTAREIKRTTVFRQPIADSFADWAESWKGDLSAAVSQYKFPEICYYCP